MDWLLGGGAGFPLLALGPGLALLVLRKWVRLGTEGLCLGLTVCSRITLDMLDRHLSASDVWFRPDRWCQRHDKRLRLGCLPEFLANLQGLFPPVLALLAFLLNEAHTLANDEARGNERDQMATNLILGVGRGSGSVENQGENGVIFFYANSNTESNRPK